MPTPPLPVPSKAALRALRGLVLGTSCSLALVLEDRRRRIHKALQIVENGKRVRGCQNYHAGASDFVIALEEETWLDSGLVRSISMATALVDKEKWYRIFAGASWSPFRLLAPMKERRRDGRGRERRREEVESRPSHGQGQRQGVQKEGNISCKEAKRDEQCEGALSMQEADRDASTRDIRTQGEGSYAGSVCFSDHERGNRGSREELPRTNRTLEAQSDPPACAPFPKATSPYRSAPLLTQGNPLFSALYDLDQRKWPPHLPTRSVENFARVNLMPRFPTTDEIITNIHTACQSRDMHCLTRAILLVQTAYSYKVAPENSSTSWMEALGLLCRTCQDTGRLEEAQNLLRNVIARGPLESDHYHGYHPLSLIESLLLRVPDVSTKAIERQTVETLVALFLPTFPAKPKGADLAVMEVGRKLLSVAFAARLDVGLLESVYWRSFNAAPLEDRSSLSQDFLVRLRRAQLFKYAIKYFQMHFAKMAQTRESILAMGDVVVHCVEDAHGWRAGPILQALQKLCATARCGLRTTWSTKLLWAHWRRHGDLNLLESLFRGVLAFDADTELVPHHDALYRVMIQAALELGDRFTADILFEEVAVLRPELRLDPRLRGLFALDRAKAGDWHDVLAEFESMKLENDKMAGQGASQSLVQILKMYADQHTVDETENFLQYFVDHLNVPLSRYMVTLVANKYGRLRDAASLTKWLQYCSHAGFTVDATFSNAILVNCSRHWKFSFVHIRRIFLALKAMSPSFVDRVTERFMESTAMRVPRCSRTRWAVRVRIRSLHIRRDRDIAYGPRGGHRELQLAMKKAMETGEPRRAVMMYKKAQQRDLVPSAELFQQAMVAALKPSGGGYTEAQGLLRHANEKGQEVTSAVNHIIIAEIQSIEASLGPIEVRRAVESAVQNLASNSIKVYTQTLNWAAKKCLDGGDNRGAVAYAHQALSIQIEEAGEHACGDAFNFATLIEAHARLCDVQGLRNTVARGLGRDSTYREETSCLRALKRARAKLAMSEALTTRQDLENARSILNHAIATAVDARKRLADDRTALETQTLAIMKQAALEAGATPSHDEEAICRVLAAGERMVGRSSGR